MICPMGDNRRVLFFAPSPRGGMAEHVHYQADELARRGFEVVMLLRPDFVKRGAPVRYRIDPALAQPRDRAGWSRIARVVAGIGHYYQLAGRVIRWRPAFVVWEANSEYYALAWAWLHWLLRLRGMIAIANFHDPVRARRWRPDWWHRVTLALAYAPLSAGLIHGPVPADARIPRRLIMREAPFGSFEDLVAKAAPFDLRQRLSLPADAFVLLAFGHIADRKNLDLVIAALAQIRQAYLVVAGSDPPRSQRPVESYADLAARRGVSDRVRFVTGFIPEAEITGYFAGCNAVCLTYDRAFVSQSGVLQIAALWDRPVLAAGGDGPLRQAVERFGLGVTVAPDSAPAIAAGLESLIGGAVDRSAAFARYRATASWRVNVDRMLDAVAHVQARRGRLSNRDQPVETHR